MSILRSIGNRFRREDHDLFEAGAHDQRGSPAAWKQSSGHTPAHAVGLPGGFMGGRIIQEALHHHHHHNNNSEDMPDLYFEDLKLGETVRALEDVRRTLGEIAETVNDHKDMLCAAAGSQRAMGQLLVEAVEPRGTEQDLSTSGSQLHKGQQQFPNNGYTDLDSHLRQAPPAGGDENQDDTTVGKFLSLEAIAAQKSLGHSFVTQSGSMIKLATAFSNPINELHSSFEERYSRKIVPLRRRYMDQKGQYLKYKRYADAAEDDEKRSYYDALAQAAKPVWIRTSKELRTEAHVMTEVTSRNIAKWSKSLALQHERGLAVAASNFSDAFLRAKGK
jgi:hypothetical protein